MYVHMRLSHASRWIGLDWIALSSLESVYLGGVSPPEKKLTGDSALTVAANDLIRAGGWQYANL